MPVSEELQLDISAALDAIDSIGSALVEAVASFRIELSTALSEAQLVKVDADASDVPSQISDAVDAADSQVTIDADTSQIGGSIDEALAAADTQVTVEVDTSQMRAEIEDAAPDAVLVEVVADTSTLAAATGDAKAATAALEDLGSGAVAAAAGLASFSGTRGLGAVTSALQRLPAGAVPAAGALAVVAAAGDQFFQSALNANAATERFNATFGAFASQINTIDIAGLDTELADLNLSLGSSTSQVRNVVSTFGQLGLASGRSAEDVALASEQLVALSARAVALNPQLGSVGDVAERLSTSLARGGRFAAQYGVALTAAEIEARALADTGKRTAAELTLFDKAAAGAALAAERYGSTLRDDIARGVENPIIQLRALSAEFAKFTTALGQPLIAPVVDIIKTMLPIAQSAANVLGALAAAFAPILDAATSALEPLVGGVLNTFADIVSSLTPLFEATAQQISSVFGPALSALNPLFSSIVGLFSALVSAIQPLLKLTQPLVELFGNVLGFFAEGAALALGAIVDVITLIVTKAGELLGTLLQPLIDAAEHFGLLGDATRDANDAQRAYASGVKATVTGVEDLAATLADTRAAFEDFVLTQSEFAGDPALINQLRRTGIGFDELAKHTANLDRGLKELVAQAIRAGQIQINVAGVEQTADQIKNLQGSLTDLLNAENTQVVTGDALLRGFVSLTLQTEAQAQANFDLIAAQQQLTDEQIRSIGVQAQQTFGVDSYANRLQVLAQTQPLVTEQQSVANTVLGQNAAAWVALTQAVAAGAVTEQQAAHAALALGVDVQTATSFIQASQKAVDEFVANAVAKLPTVATVWDQMKTATNPADPQSLTNNLNLATLSALTFQANLDTIRQKFPEVAAFLQEKGPEAAGAFAQNFLAAGEEIQRELEAAIVANKAAINAIETDLRASISSNSAAAAALGQEVAAQLGLGMDFSGVTEEQVNAMASKLAEAGVIDPVRATAGDVGHSVGAALAFGLGAGLFDNFPVLEAQAREAIRRMQEAMESEAGIRSPSRLFAAIGMQLTSGLAHGLERGAADVVAAAEAIIADAAAALSAESLRVDTGGPRVNAITFGGVNVSITVDGATDVATAEQAGRAAADAFVDQAAVKLEALIS